MGTNISSSSLINTEQILVQQSGGAEVVKKSAPIKLTGDSAEVVTASLTGTPTLKTPAKRSETELRTSFRSVCIANGLNPTEAELERIISIVTSGQTIKALLNIEQAEITRYLDALKTAFKDVAKKPDGSINTEEVAQLAQKYQIATMNGVWESIDSFKKRDNGKSISARMNDFYTINITMEEKVKGYFTKYYAELAAKKLEGITDPVAREKKIAQITKLLTQDLQRIVANSTPEEIPLIREALKAVNNSGLQIYGIDLMLAACESKEQRSATSRDILLDEEFQETLRNATEEPDVTGQILSAEAFDTAIVNLYSNLNDEDFETTHQALDLKTAKYYEKLSIIEAKLEKGEELTPEEKVFYENAKPEEDYLTRMSANEHIGTAINTVITDVQEKMEELHRDALDYRNCRDVYNYINNSITEIAESLNIDLEEFTEMMNQATNGNYEIILNDIKNGTKTELNPPLEPETITSNASTNETGIGIVVNNNEQTTPLTENQKKTFEKLQDTILKEEKSKAREARRAGDNAGAERILRVASHRILSSYAKHGYSFSETLQKTGCTLNEGIVYAYENEDSLPTLFVNNAKEAFKDLTPKEQVKFIVGHGEKAYNFLKNELSQDAILALKDENVGSSTLKSAIENAAEIIEERQQNQ